MKIVNLTPHVVNIAGTDYPPAGPEQVAHPLGVPFYSVDHGIPYPTVLKTPGILYVVSQLVLQHSPNRLDYAAPASGHPNVTRADGQITSVPGLLVNGHYQWVSDSHLQRVLDMEESQWDDFSNLLSGVPETGDLTEIFVVCNWITGEYPDLNFHILDVRPENNGDELEWLIAIA